MATLDQPTPMSDAPWPKRTSRACCICRRDKIKCDGERPCAACLRRGLTGENCIDGCPPCRRFRARCDGGDPCGRCLEYGIDCSDDPASPGLSIDDSLHRPNTTNDRSAPAGRAKLACKACRRDNKKCDDNRPCSRCVSRMEECIHVERIPKAVKHRCVNCRKDNRKCEDKRPCGHCAEMKLECVDAPRKGSGASRVKMACANCRRNKVQCDPERPCRVCVRRGLECTMPSCTCAETGYEFGTCTFCRSQGSKRNSQTQSDPGNLEGRQSSTTDTPPSATSNLSEVADFQGSHSTQSQSHTYGHFLSSQGRSFPTDFPLASGTFTPQPYSANYSAQQGGSYRQQSGQQVLSEMAHAANSFGLPAKLDDQGQHAGLSTAVLQSGRQSFTMTKNTLEADFGDLGSSGAGSASNLDKFVSRCSNVGTYAPLSDFSVQSDFVPLYPPTSPSSHVVTGLSSGSSGNFDDGVDVGIGTYEPDRTTGFDSLTQAYGPVPMAMPISMTIPVPRGADIRKDTDSQIGGQIDMHPQLRHSAYYLISDSRTAQRGDGP